MRKLIYALLLFIFFPAFSYAQSLEALSSEFETPAELSNWTWLHAVEQWPDKTIKHTISDGSLIVEPGTSGWFADKNAPFLFKEVKGDFDVRARVRATGLTNAISETVWSLGGLMVAFPNERIKHNGNQKKKTGSL